MHDLLSGNTPEAMAARAAAERRERTEKELAKEREKRGFRKDMPLHRTYFHDIAQPAKIPGAAREARGLHRRGRVPRVRTRSSRPRRCSTMFMQIFPFTEHSREGRRACAPT